MSTKKKTAVDERTKKLFEWAVRFSETPFHGQDVRREIQTLVQNIVQAICQQPDLSALSDEAVLELGAMREKSLAQLDTLRGHALTAALAAKLERVNDGKKSGGDTTAQLNKSDAAARDIAIRSAAEGLLKANRSLSNTGVAGILAARGHGGKEAIRKKLPKLLKK